MQILYNSLYTFHKGANKENISNNQEHPQLAMISFIPRTLNCDSAGDVVRRSYSRYWSLLGAKGLTSQSDTRKHQQEL